MEKKQLFESWREYAFRIVRNVIRRLDNYQRRIELAEAKIEELEHKLHNHRHVKDETIEVKFKEDFK